MLAAVAEGDVDPVLLAGGGGIGAILRVAQGSPVLGVAASWSPPLPPSKPSLGTRGQGGSRRTRSARSRRARCRIHARRTRRAASSPAGSSSGDDELRNLRAASLSRRPRGQAAYGRRACSWKWAGRCLTPAMCSRVELTRLASDVGLTLAVTVKQELGQKEPRKPGRFFLPRPRSMWRTTKPLYKARR